MIIQANIDEAKDVAALALKLWPNNTIEQFEHVFTSLLNDSTAAIFLAQHDGQFIGFVQCQLRHDYVEGTDSSPVGYLEGLFVLANYRERGVARDLIAACEQWIRDQGCSEMASDCELTNDVSIMMHQRLGFQEANRIVCFTKKL